MTGWLLDVGETSAWTCLAEAESSDGKRARNIVEVRGSRHDKVTLVLH